MGRVVKCLFFISFSFILTTVQAQRPKADAKSTPVQKFKPPKLHSFLGIRSDSAEVAVEEGLQLITLSLKVTDDKKNPYAISSYQLLYRRKAVTENEETGKVSPTTSAVVQFFRETPITEFWKRNITEQLQSGEELYFFDIVAKDAQGRLMFAPDLKIKIK